VGFVDNVRYYEAGCKVFYQFKLVLMIHCRRIKSNEEFHLFNVYAPCEPSAKKMLWDSLSVRLQMLGGVKSLCLCGL